MSTRSNVVIKGNGKMVQLYHHHDGYPEGVGSDLQDRLNGLKDDKEKWAKVLSDPQVLANILASDKDDEYELEGDKLYLHGDIEYLYVIDLDKQTVTCQDVWVWDLSSKDEQRLVDGEFEKDDKGDKARLVYKAAMTDSWKLVEQTIDDGGDDDGSMPY